MTPPPNNPLALVCSACRTGPFSYENFRNAVSKGHYTDTSGYVYTRTWKQIVQSIDKEACAWCRIVRRTRDGLPGDKFPPADKQDVEVRIQIENGARKGINIYLDGFKAVGYSIWSQPGDAAIKEIGKEFSLFKKEPYADYQRAKECIKACSDHEHCNTIEDTYLPTRVIDCSNPSKPRLVETNRKIKGHYCTLSYAWGGEQHQKTTKANLGTYVKGINVPLPQTIADAIYVTNQIGCKYLWVDALCIIQDSDEDKVKELADMAHIYSDSYVTISALSAFRADQGFLPDARPPDILPYFVEGSKTPSRMSAEFDIPRQTPGLGKYETVVMYRPLDERGWCLQESALAPRRLIFQPPHVSFKCRSFGERNITRPTPLDITSQSESTPYPIDDHILFPTNKGTDLTAKESDLRERWRKILWDYSERKITVASDKFVALAGVAEIFERVSKDKYIAGLWKRTFMDDLLWEIWAPAGPEETFLPRPPKYRAPTWSWASVDAKLHLEVYKPTSADASYEAEILACNVTPKNRIHPLGEIVDAKLTLKAKIHPLMRNGKKCTFTVVKGQRFGDRFVSNATTWKCIPPQGNCLEPVGSKKKGDDGDEERVKGITFDSEEGTAPAPPLDFHVLALRAGRKWRNQGDWMQGFLVVRVEGEANQYRRVAKLDLMYEFQWPDWFDATPLKTVVLV
ncbi:hypothetical protein CVT26_015155 [Gymnopilus dilepis]|uniref:Heterokaryon incompatibility domain-containing protein n=1 Tax=Gymnopilus dilepis TaxID=231916 RepID=A0A409WA39_9AGAR|nr:hypothetical protein CVT26_015155 [Gymnopilus dilepis]